MAGAGIPIRRKSSPLHPVKTKALIDIDFIKEAVAFYGSQCISIAVDAFKTSEGYKIFNHLDIDKSLDDYVQEMIDCKVGEFVLASVDNDGMMNGFDIELINCVEKITNIQ